MASFEIDISGIDSAQAALEEAKPQEAEYRVNAGTSYAVYVEFGTKHMEAQPFLRPAVNQTMREAESIFEDSDDVDEFVEALAERIQEHAKESVPVRTGRLKRSITVEEL